jgi:hypothetical protein
MALLNLPDSSLSKIRLIPIRVIQIHVMNETTRVQSVRDFPVPLEFRRSAVFARCDRAAAKIHSNSDPHRVQDSDGPRQVLSGAIDVLVQIDNAMVPSPFIGPG